MSRITSKGKLSTLRVHREIGFGGHGDHVLVHAVVQLGSEPDKTMGFALTENSDLPVHKAWVDLLRDAFSFDHTVILETDFDTQEGHNGILRTVTLTKR